MVIVAMKMKQAIGLDIVDSVRISNLLNKYGNRFVRKILAKDEQALFEKRPDRSAFLAGRFAAKEAAIKALGSYIIRRPALGEICILPDSSGQPILSFGKILSEQLTGVSSLISISHEKTHAVAVVLLTGGK